MEGIFVRTNQDRSYVPLYFKKDGFWYEYCGRRNKVCGDRVPPVFSCAGPKLLIQWQTLYLTGEEKYTIVDA